jgi:hypothetical protein
MSQLVKTEEAGLSNDFLQSLIDSKHLPSHVKTVQTAFTIAQMGKELGFAPMQALHQIVPIQGKLSLSAKAIGAVLRKGGVKFRTVEDGVFVYPDKVSIEKIEGEKAITMRTTIEFTRDGVAELCSFTWRDAELAGLTTKDNWKRMPKEMLYARCLAKGANRIGQDLLLGLYMTDELADAFNVSESNVVRDEDGYVTEIKDSNINSQSSI